jgi:glucose/arabinose dehydrogenase
MRIPIFLIMAAVAVAQPQANPLGAGPWNYTTYEKNTKIRVSVVTRGLAHPWGLVFLPGTNDMIVTERPGRVRLIHNGVVAPAPIADLSALSVDVLFDIALHPDFASNGFVYLTYIKKGTLSE